MRELPDERFVPTVPDFFVEEVRLEAAAARFVGLAELRALEAAPLAGAFAPLLAAPRLEERAEVFEAEERALVEREALFDPLRAEVEREAAGFLAADFVDFVDFVAALVVDLAADLAGAFLADEREVVDFAAVFLAPDFAAVFLAPDFAAVLAEDFTAVLDEDLAAVLDDFAAVLDDFAAVFVPAFFAAVLFEAVLFEPDFAALFAAPERDEVPVDFAALLRAVEAPVFLAPDFAEDLEPPVFLALDELRRALLFFAPDLVLVAPVSPVNSIVSGFDLSSVGIAASFKGLRVQPSRLQGNVVIPRGFRLSESVESRTRMFSVDTLCSASVRTCASEAQRRSRQMTRQRVACSALNVFPMS
ncbi:DEAD/DEAH box helicase [Microvirga lenta]|uniref:hypothetical protein n=1 Tax=Microvirga lenta TaxID=2881337 RepID=UPI001CFF461E|nr:hypothetical protein [Microvirga lenta]MCB5174137.1 hypothetical protein [Microvirga lenta]